MYPSTPYSAPRLPQTLPADARPQPRRIFTRARTHGPLTSSLDPLGRVLLRGPLAGARFQSQVQLGAYTVQYYCPEVLLAVELDEGSPLHKAARDAVREQQLAPMGVMVIRYDAATLVRDLPLIEAHITQWVHRRRAALQTSPVPPAFRLRGVGLPAQPRT